MAKRNRKNLSAKYQKTIESIKELKVANQNKNNENEKLVTKEVVTIDENKKLVIGEVKISREKMYDFILRVIAILLSALGLIYHS